MKTNEIRQAFLDYFINKGHALVPSSSLVPHDDPTLLFTNAGMVQFKDVFLGLDKSRGYNRAVSSQRCVRAGGKHNDLENVGLTARHHTFFEMLGNFSFGDYFKREAINYAWDFLTNVLQLPPEKLWVTVHTSDTEAEKIWLEELKVSKERFSRCGDEDNFWSMGDTGPCGPCTEIFYDHGEAIAGGPPGTPTADGDRYIEIWNLVFMQYDRGADGSLKPLPKPSVDTGMGLERIAAVQQQVHNNYDIDLFQALIKAAAREIGIDDLNHTSLKVIADHIRSTAFLITDGIVPANEGRGYVLRRIMRRAIRHGRKLGAADLFFYKLVAPLCAQMGEAFPELLRARVEVENTIKHEEKQFAKTVDQGLKILEQDIKQLQGKVIPGETVFKLYDTYGFPVDLTNDIARERGLTLDQAGFDACMNQQRKRARESSSFSAYSKQAVVNVNSEFCGYDGLFAKTNVIAIFNADGETVQMLEPGDYGQIVLARTPFYAESGGQAGDIGVLKFKDGEFTVTDTQKSGKAHVHFGKAKAGVVTEGLAVEAEVLESNRRATMRNHSATHLLHSALRKILGEHVRQKGSLVNAERLRFDFSHPKAVTAKQMQQMEDMVNAQVLLNTEASIAVTTMKEATAKGALAFFEEKYEDPVRVLSMGGDFSVELCGGTHVKRTGDIGLVKIISETGIAAGVRRIEAIAGLNVIDYLRLQEQKLEQIAQTLKADKGSVVEKVAQLQANNKKLEQELAKMQQKLAADVGSQLAAQAKDIKGVKVLASDLGAVDAKSLRDLVDQLKNKLGSGVIVLAATADAKVSIIAGVTKDLVKKISAKELINMVAAQVGGKGGGRDDLAQAGGSNPNKVPAAIASVEPWVTQKL